MEGMYAQIVLFDGFDPLDVIAPYEVLVAGSDYLGGELGVELVSAEGPRSRRQRVPWPRPCTPPRGWIPPDPVS